MLCRPRGSSQNQTKLSAGKLRQHTVINRQLTVYTASFTCRIWHCMRSPQLRGSSQIPFTSLGKLHLREQYNSRPVRHTENKEAQKLDFQPHDGTLCMDFSLYSLYHLPHSVLLDQRWSPTPSADRACHYRYQSHRAKCHKDETLSSSPASISEAWRLRWRSTLDQKVEGCRNFRLCEITLNISETSNALSIYAPLEVHVRRIFIVQVSLANVRQWTRTLGLGTLKRPYPLYNQSQGILRSSPSTLRAPIRPYQKSVLRESA